MTLSYQIPPIKNLQLLQQQLNGDYGAQFLTGISSSLVIAALGYTPYNATNPSGYISAITSGMVTGALGYTPYNAANPSGYISGITSGMVTGALGYTPVNPGVNNRFNVGLSINTVPFGWTGGAWFEVQSSSGSYSVSGYNSGNGGGALIARVDSVNSGFLYCNYQGSGVGSITTNSTSTFFNTTSDERLKSFTGEYAADAALAIIKADPVRSFTWNSLSPSPGVAAVGWGAQTSYAVSQDLASPGSDELDESGHPLRLWGVDQAKRTPYLWAAIGAAGGILDQLDVLRAQVATLQAQVAALQTAGG